MEQTLTIPATILSVDVEDYFMSPETIHVSEWDRYSCRIEIGSDRLLSIMKEFDVRATWFFLGWVADRYPDLVRRVAESGHELAVHGYDHRFVTDLSRSEFEASLERSRTALGAAVPGAGVIGHRAPAFSLRRDVDWHWQVLGDQGFEYDSSLMPFATYLYGDKSLPLEPYRVDSLIELPPAAIRVFGRSLPVGGGGVLRALPNAYLAWARARYRSSHHLPPVIHIHPWELDPEHPVPDLPSRQRLIHSIGLRTVERKIKRILSEGPCETVGWLHQWLRDTL